MAYDQNGNFYVDPMQPMDQDLVAQRLRERQEQQAVDGFIDAQFQQQQSAHKMNEIYINKLKELGHSPEEINEMINDGSADNRTESQSILNQGASEAATRKSNAYKTRKQYPANTPGGKGGQFMPGPETQRAQSKDLRALQQRVDKGHVLTDDEALSLMPDLINS